METTTLPTTTLFTYMEQVVKSLRRSGRDGTADNYSAALNSFRRYRHGADIAISQLDRSVVDDYQDHLRQSSLTPNSISFYMRILRAVYNRSLGESPSLQDRQPFRNAFTGMEKTAKRAVSLSDIRRVRDIDLSGRSDLRFARDIFMFQFYCRGMSFIDAANLRKTDVSNGTITYRRRKTRQQLRIKILPPISRIVEIYSLPDSPYLLPIIRRPGEPDERRQYQAALRRVNNALKTISARLELPHPLTTYVSRHTWATLAKMKNIPISVISDALGHDSIATTQIYLASMDASEIDAANELIIGDL